MGLNSSEPKTVLPVTSIFLTGIVGVSGAGEGFGVGDGRTGGSEVGGTGAGLGDG
jgi:hypothetical protein